MACYTVCSFVGLTAAIQFSASKFLKKHETKFFEVVDPRLSLFRLVRKGVITEDVKSDITTSNTKDAREVLYHHLAHHANVDTLKEYCEVAIDAEGYPKMRSLGRKMMEELKQGGWSELCAKLSLCVCVCVCVCGVWCAQRPAAAHPRVFRRGPGQPTLLTVFWPTKQDPGYCLGPALRPLWAR